MTTEYTEMLAQRGGMATCGDYLGVYVGTDPLATPPGWTYVALPTTPEIVQQALDHTKLGRSTWPDKVLPDQTTTRPK